MFLGNCVQNTAKYLYIENQSFYISFVFCFTNYYLSLLHKSFEYCPCLLWPIPFSTSEYTDVVL